MLRVSGGCDEGVGWGWTLIWWRICFPVHVGLAALCSLQLSCAGCGAWFPRAPCSSLPHGSSDRAHFHQGECLESDIKKEPYTTECITWCALSSQKGTPHHVCCILLVYKEVTGATLESACHTQESGSRNSFTHLSFGVGFQEKKLRIWSDDLIFSIFHKTGEFSRTWKPYKNRCLIKNSRKPQQLGSFIMIYRINILN